MQSPAAGYDRKPALNLTLVLLLVMSGAAAAEFPGWRGDGSGIVGGSGYPVAWSAERNVTWRIPLSGHGHSSPAVTDDAVAITLSNDEGTRRTVICFNRADGELRWRRSFDTDSPEPTHHRNGYASATPVADDGTLYVSLGSIGVVALALEDGAVQWHRELEPPTHPWGEAAGLRLFEDLLILHRHADATAHLLALRSDTGETVWRRDLPTEAEAEVDDDAEAAPPVSLATPAIRASALGEELIVSRPGGVAAFNPVTGRPYWRATGLGDRVIASAMLSDDYLAAADADGRVLAMQLPGVETGDVTAGTRLFLRREADDAQLATGLIVGEHLFLADAAGQLECVSLDSGQIVWRESLGEAAWASLHAAEGRLYVTDVRGNTHIVPAHPSYEKIRTNALAEGDHVVATPTFSDGQIFIRTYTHLYCIGQRR